MIWRRIARIEGNPEHWVLQANNASVCSLRRGETLGTWQASFLNLSGKSNVVAHSTATSLEQAQRNCEKELRLMGWKLGQEAAE